jgi:biopolymer transport protein ExbD
MKRRVRTDKLVAEINITPFTDVILVLLVIFMIATPLIFQASIKVNLPQASSAAATKEIKQIYITLTDTGVIYFDKMPVTKRELKDKITAMHKNNSVLSVVLRADKVTKFKDVVSVLDILNELGIKNVNVAALSEES